jgi:outer membrane biosynthesis protein TonB
LRANYLEGWVVVQLDIVKGVPERVVVVSASPERLFDRGAIVVGRSGEYPADASVKGCVLPVDFKFEVARP